MNGYRSPFTFVEAFSSFIETLSKDESVVPCSSSMLMESGEATRQNICFEKVRCRTWQSDTKK